MAKAVYRAVTCNVEMPDSYAQERSTIREAWSHADVLCIQEGYDPDVRRSLRLLHDATWDNTGNIAKHNPIVWRKSKFTKLGSGERTGYTGGQGDGPSRGVAWVLLGHKASGKRVLHFNIHQIAKAWTTHTGRQGKWNDIQHAVSNEIEQTMDQYPGVPAVICGDFNKPGDVWFDNINETELSSPDTFGPHRYDRFFLVGGIDNTNFAHTYTTQSDHKTLAVALNITTTAPAKPKPPKPKPKPAKDTSKPPVELPPVPQEVLRGSATFKRRERWRYFAMRIGAESGGQGEIIHPNLPLSDVEIEDVLTGHNSLSGNISPEYRSLVAPDGKLLMSEYTTAIFAEESGNIHGGGILTNSGFDGPSWNIECTGYTSYLDGLPYTDSKFFVEEDPLDIYRHVWDHVESFNNIGLNVDNTMSGILIGTELEQAEFDTESGPVSFEAGPIKLAWYETHDLGGFMDTLATNTPFDWHEEHRWEGDELRHFIRLGYPQIGRRREDLRFVIGENIHVIPSVERSGEEYATECLVLGSGEGSAMVRGSARRDHAGGLRRVAVVADPTIKTKAAANKRATQELTWRGNLDNVSEIVVRKHAHADTNTMRVGDEILLQGDAGWVEIAGWHRITSRRIRPYGDGTMSLTVQRTDRQAA